MRQAALLEVIQELEWVLDAAAAPALYLVLDDVPNRVPHPLSERLGGAEHVALVHPQDRDWIDRISGVWAQGKIGIIEGGLSSLTPAERPAVNAARERLLAAGRKLVLVEPASKEQELLRDFPDVMSVVRDIFEIHPVYEDDHLYDSGNAWRLRTIAARLPPVITAGATIIHGGKVHFKQAPQIVCPRCGTPLQRGTTTLVFQHAPPNQREQVVSAWVCPCGESYVPGTVARDAHAAAFRYREGQDEFEIHLSEDEKHRLLRDWVHHGPQGPIDEEGDPDLP